MPFLSISGQSDLTKNVTGFLLQHDNAPTHNLETQKPITKLRWTVLPYPPHSPDLAPLDSQLFGARKDAIHGKRFGVMTKLLKK